MNSRDFLSFVSVHKSEGTTSSLFFLSPGAPDGSLDAVLSSRERAGRGRKDESICADWYTVHRFPRASLSILITQGFKWPQNAFVPQYQ